MVDAIDEALDPLDLVDQVLRPFIEAAQRSGIRLLLGTRPHLLDRLGPATIRLDLDSPEYADSASLRNSAARYLRHASPAGAGGPAAADVIDRVADAVAEIAGTSFLIALIVTRSLAARADLPDPADPAWRASLPRTAAEAMNQDLKERLGEQTNRARDLLAPLAYAYGAGLPWEDIWAPLASALAGASYTDDDLVWLRRAAGAYIIEAQQAGHSVYRLYHEALAEALRDGRDPAAVNAVLTEFLSRHTPDAGDGTRSWARAHPYVRSHLAPTPRRPGGWTICCSTRGSCSPRISRT